MATKIFNEGVTKLSTIDYTAATIKALLLMTNTTADTENDGIANTGNFTTLDEADGANYVRKTLASKTSTKDDTANRVILSCADITWTALGNGTRNIAGVLIVVDIAATLYPISWHEFGSPRVATGADFLVEIRSDTGLITIEAL